MTIDDNDWRVIGTLSESLWHPRQWWWVSSIVTRSCHRRHNGRIDLGITISDSHPLIISNSNKRASVSFCCILLCALFIIFYIFLWHHIRQHGNKRAISFMETSCRSHHYFYSLVRIWFTSNVIPAVFPYVAIMITFHRFWYRESFHKLPHIFSMHHVFCV